VVLKPEGDRPLGTPRRMWDYSIKMNLKSKFNDCGPDCSDLGQAQVAESCESVNEIVAYIKVGIFLIG
jgi:hypothetical protein